MTIVGQRFTYPGADVKPAATLKLAEQYRLAAVALRTHGRRRKPLTFAPYRLVAIHAIELYLNSLLLAKGISPATVRGMQHDFAARIDAAKNVDLKLGKGTEQHLRSLMQTREYLTARYDPEFSKASEVTRLEATLHEVATKAAIIVNQATLIT